MTKLVVYRVEKNLLQSVTMPAENASEIWNEGKTNFKGVEYLKKDVISTTKEIGHIYTNPSIKINYSTFDASILSALDETGVRHQPNYCGYDGRKLTDIEFIQMLRLRFGYKNIIE
tara:strand:+ start:348 stop:695 length:348 start_codon:yes stop_codon:yes gene_type:complete